MDSLFGKLKHEAIKIKREAKKVAELETPIERKIREATSNQNWGCPNSVLYEITVAAQDFHDRRKITKAFEEKLCSEPHRWRRILKTLTLLEFIIKNCSEDILPEMITEQTRVRRLQNFCYSEEGKEKGQPVRDKANAIIDLVSNAVLLRAAREETKSHRQKMVQGARDNVQSGSNASSSRRPDENHGRSRASMEKRFDELKKKRDSDIASANRVRTDQQERARDNDADRDRRSRDDSPRDDRRDGYEIHIAPPDERREKPQANVLDWGGEGDSSSDDGAAHSKAKAEPTPQAVDLLDLDIGGADSGSAPSGGYTAFAAPAAAGGGFLDFDDPPPAAMSKPAVLGGGFADFGSSGLAPPPTAPTGVGGGGAGFADFGAFPSSAPKESGNAGGDLLDLM